MSNRGEEPRERVITSRERARFRKTKEWRDWRETVRKKHQGKDPITGKRLPKGWNCHHLNMNKEEYEVLGDIDLFEPLSQSIHDAVHAIWRYYEKDEGVLDRFCELLRHMKEVSQEEKR